MKKRNKILLVIFLLIVLIVSVLVVKHLFFGYRFESAIDCVNDAADREHWGTENVIYTYENNDYALVIYNTEGGDYFTSYCKKQKKNDTYYYKNVLLTNMLSPSTYQKEWNKVGKSLYFIYVAYENDIEEIDACGYQPVGTRIQYKNSAEETKTCWIYVVDTTLDSENTETFYNYKEKGLLGF